MFKIHLVSFVILQIFALNLAENKLNVIVLYESLCPDSESFMRSQLGRSYDSLKDHIDIKLVPFGKSQSFNNGSHFICQHGPAECLGNRQQSCVLQQTTNQELQVKFAVCQMTTPNRDTIKACAESAGLSSNIEECMNGTLGTRLQLEAERITRQYSPSFVPTIIYDGVFNQQLQDASLFSFYGTVMRLLQKRGIISFNNN